MAGHLSAESNRGISGRVLFSTKVNQMLFYYVYAELSYSILFHGPYLLLLGTQLEYHKY